MKLKILISEQFFDGLYTISILSAPSGVSMVMLLSRSHTSLTVAWQPPVSPNGLITHYNLSAFSSQSGSQASASLEITAPEQELQVSLGGLLPATAYLVTLTAFTSAGGNSGPPAEITTLESGIT